MNAKLIAAKQAAAKEYLEFHKVGQTVAGLLHGTNWHTTETQAEMPRPRNVILDAHARIIGIHANPPFLEKPPHEYYGQADPLRITDEQFRDYQNWKDQLLGLETTGLKVSIEAKTNLRLADTRGRLRMDGEEPRQVRSVEIRRENLSEERWKAFVDGLIVETKILELKAMGAGEPNKGNRRQIKPTSST